MAKIEIFDGDDWAKLVVDGVTKAEGHSIARHEWAQLLRELGHDVAEPEGDFCQGGCGRWIPASSGGQLCEPCTNWEALDEV